MVKYEFDGEIGENYGEKDIKNPSVIFIQNNVNCYDVDGMFEIWKQFMSGLGYGMDKYYLVKEGELL